MIGSRLEQPVEMLTRLCSIFVDDKPRKPEAPKPGR